MFKIELENRDFRKSLYFYIVDAEKKNKLMSSIVKRPLYEELVKSGKK